MSLVNKVICDRCEKEIKDNEFYPYGQYNINIVGRITVKSNEDKYLPDYMEETDGMDFCSKWCMQDYFEQKLEDIKEQKRKENDKIMEAAKEQNHVDAFAQVGVEEMPGLEKEEAEAELEAETE